MLQLVARPRRLVRYIAANTDPSSPLLDALHSVRTFRTIQCTYERLMLQLSLGFSCSAAGTIFKKILLDQLVMTPVQTVIFFAFMRSAEARRVDTDEILKDVKAKLPKVNDPDRHHRELFASICSTKYGSRAPMMESASLERLEAAVEKTVPSSLRPQTLLAGYSLWPLAHVVNFRFVPSQMRLLYINAVMIGWTAVLRYAPSVASHRARPEYVGELSFFPIVFTS